MLSFTISSVIVSDAIPFNRRTTDTEEPRVLADQVRVVKVNVEVHLVVDPIVAIVQLYQSVVELLLRKGVYVKSVSVNKNISDGHKRSRATHVSLY